MYNSLFEYRINNRIVTRNTARMIIGDLFHHIRQEAFRFWYSGNQNWDKPFSYQFNKNSRLTITYIEPQEATNAS